MRLLTTAFRAFRKNMRITSTKTFTSKKLCYGEFGDPLKVLKLAPEELSAPKSDEVKCKNAVFVNVIRNPMLLQVIVQFLVASVNPADINTIQGVYPVKPNLPAVGGFEGVGEVVRVGDNVASLEIGDRVIPDVGTAGTWRTFAIFKSNELLKVSKEVNVIEMAGISSNPSTAYRMLKDFVPLSDGDVVIQNGANGACGQNVVQLCRSWNVKSVNVVRDRPDIRELKDYLRNLGADYILTEEELRATKMFKDGSCPKPKLALNSVGGKSSTELTRHVENGGTVVTYGGMSKEPVVVPTSAFIFKDLIFRGFWMSRWLKMMRTSPERREMLDELSKFMADGKLKAPVHKLVTLDDYEEAVSNTLSSKGFAGCKYLFDLKSSVA